MTFTDIREMFFPLGFRMLLLAFLLISTALLEGYQPAKHHAAEIKWIRIVMYGVMVLIVLMGLIKD